MPIVYFLFYSKDVLPSCAKLNYDKSPKGDNCHVNIIGLSKEHTKNFAAIITRDLSSIHVNKCQNSNNHRIQSVEELIELKQKYDDRYPQ